MAKFDEQLSRMEYLMGYRMPIKESVSKIEYHTEGADGKVYGILKEGTKYYIKTTEKGKETLAESYEYIGGFNYRNENGFNSYNQATKILEQKMMALNESMGIHKDVSTVDFKRSEKLLENLTKEARKELDRVKLIMENSNKIGIKNNIGDHGDPESKGKSNPSNTTGLNNPFNEKAKAQLDKDVVATETDPKKANSDYTDASKNVESQMTSDKAPTKNVTNSEKDYKDAHDDLDGDGVADKKPKGGKAVMVNEGLLDQTFDDVVETPIDQFQDDVPAEDSDITADEFGVEQPVGAPVNEPATGTNAAPVGNNNDLVGIDDENDDFDALMEEFKSIISGDDETLTGPHGSLDVQTVDEAAAASQNPKSEEKQEALNGPKGNGEVLTWDKLNEDQKKQVNEVVDGVVKALFEGRQKKQETLEEKITRIVKENLNVWGDHPKYGEEPMTTPPNKEVMKGTADRDFNDDSAKGSERYGKKIGDGKPFDKAVEMLTDSVMNVIKEALKKK